MVRHIVLFKLVEFDSAALKQQKMDEIKSALEALPKLIPQLVSLEVGLNANASEKFDICLNTVVASMEDLEIYAKHPDHLAVGAIIRAVLADRACVDSIF